jgi:nucleotide-binding universal stress UspA family protein
MDSPDPQTSAPIIATFAPGHASHEPIDFGLAASRLTGAPLVIVAVEHGVAVMNDVVFAHDEAIAELRETLRHRGIRDPDIRAFDDSSPSRRLTRAIHELESRLIVLGTTRRGATVSTLLGTIAERVIHEGACPVAIVPPGYQRPEGGVQVIGAAYAPTDEGREALQVALALSRARGTRVRAITVLDPKHAAEQSHGLMAEQQREVSPTEAKAGRRRLSAEDDLAEAVAELGRGVEVEFDVLTDDPADGLIAASRHVDMLVMGPRALGPKRAVVLGSVSRKVVAGAACPVLVLPRGTERQSEALLADVESQTARSG